MSFSKITEKETAAILADDAHVLVTQTQTVNGQDVHALRRVPIEGFANGLSNLITPGVRSDTGDPAALVSIRDGADNAPAALEIDILPVQAGSGTPAPDNIRAITGWTGAGITRSGKNLFDINGGTSYAFTGASVQNGKIVLSSIASGAQSRIYFSKVYNAGTYTFSAKSTGGVTGIRFFSPKQFAGGEYNAYYGGYFKALTDGALTVTMTEPFTVGVIAQGTAGSYGEVYDIQLELGSAASAYAPYVGTTYSVTFPGAAGTVYGGKLEIARDGSGILTVNFACLDGTNWSPYGAASDGLVGYARGSCPSGTKTSAFLPGEAYASFTELFSWDVSKVCVQFPRSNLDQAFIRVPAGFDLANVQLVYPVKVPQTYSLSAAVIKTLLGDNRIWADCGPLRAQYSADVRLYIDYKIAELQALALENN